MGDESDLALKMGELSLNGGLFAAEETEVKKVKKNSVEIPVTHISRPEHFVSCNQQAFPQLFLDGMDKIYRFGEKDIADGLNALDTDCLASLRSSLAVRSLNLFAQLQGKRVIGRQSGSKSKVVTDIYIMGWSLTNETPHADLGKLFKKDSSTKTDNSEGAENNITALLKALAELRGRIEKQEQQSLEIAKLQERLAILEQGSTASGKESAPGTSKPVADNAPHPDQIAPSTAADAVEDGAVYSDSEDPQSDSDSDGNDESDSEEEEDGAAAAAAAASVQKPPVLVPNLPSHCQCGQQKTTKPKPKSSQAQVLPKTFPALKGADEERSVYVGNVHWDCDNKMIKEYLGEMGVVPRNIQQISASDSKRSFKINVSVTDYDVTVEKGNWPDTLSVRPFRPQNNKQGVLKGAKPRSPKQQKKQKRKGDQKITQKPLGKTPQTVQTYTQQGGHWRTPPPPSYPVGPPPGNFTPQWTNFIGQQQPGYYHSSAGPYSAGTYSPGLSNVAMFQPDQPPRPIWVPQGYGQGNFVPGQRVQTPW